MDICEQDRKYMIGCCESERRKVYFRLKSLEGFPGINGDEEYIKLLEDYNCYNVMLSVLRGQ